MKGRRTRVLALAWTLAAAVLVGLTVGSAAPAMAATTVHGTYVTPTTAGTLTYTAQRGFRGGSEGRFVVGGRSYPGSMYAANNGGTGLVWYYGTSGIMAGNALVTKQPDGTYSGPIWFFARSGSTTDTGTLAVTFG